MLIFEHQAQTKFSQRRNYRNAAYLYCPTLTRANWVFWLKHSAFRPATLWDKVGYSAAVNVLAPTQLLAETATLVLTQVSLTQPTTNLVVISTTESPLISASSVAPGAAFYEREVAEMFQVG